VAFSPDGKQIASAGSWDDTIRLWDAAGGREPRVFSGHSEWVTSVAFSRDGERIASGAWDNTIRLWDAAGGREPRVFSGHSGRVRSVAFSPGGKRIASGSGDGTIRLWDAASGKEIARFIGFADGEWLCITPDGYYTASPKGDQYLNVRVGNGNTVYGIDQYRATFYKPQTVEARLSGSPEAAAQTAIQAAASFEPPVVVIRGPENGKSFSEGQAELSVSVIDQKQPLKSVRVVVNGRLVGSDEMKNINGSRGVKVVATGLDIGGSEKRLDFRFPVNLSPGPNRIEVFASNPYSEGRDMVEVTGAQAASQTQDILPNLWILAIGVNRYEDAQIRDLDYAVNDARGIVEAFKKQEGKAYRKVNSLLIADAAALSPTRDNILDNLGWLKQAGQRDVVLLFIAGHGVNDEGGNFLFLPKDAAFTPDGSVRPSRAIPHREISAVLDVPGRKLVFIDSCHSEGASGRRTRAVDNNQLVRGLMDNSTVIFTSSRGSQLSQEDPKLKHGLFTYAIIEGMKGAADLVKDGVITMKELDTYVSQEVPRLTKGAQHPTTTTPDGYVDFGVAAVK
jgi:hypothetical protein